MAKIQDDNKEIKAMLQKLFSAVKVMSSASEEQHRINKELMKVMSLLNSGFIESAQDANKLIDTIKNDGFNLTDEFIKKWAKARKLTDEDLKNIVKKFHEIDDIGDDIIDSAKDYTDLLEDQIGSLEDSVDLSTKLLRNQNKIAEAIEASKKQAMALGGTTDEINRLTEQLVQKKVDLSGMFGGMFKGMEDGKALVDNIRADIDSMVQRASDSDVEVSFYFNPLSGDLDKEVKKALNSIDLEKKNRLQGLQEYYDKNTELQDKIAKQMATQKFATDIKFDVNTSDITTAAGVLQKGTSEYQSALDRLSKIVSDNNLGKIVSSNLKEMVSLLEKGADLTEEQNKSIIKYRDTLDDANKLIYSQIDAKVKDLNLLEQSIIGEKARLITVGKYTNQLTAARGVVEKIGEGFDYVNQLLPSGVSDFLGISKVSLSLLEAHKKGVESFSEYIKEGGDLTKSMGVYMAEIGPSIRTALSPMTLLVAAGAVLFQTLRTAVQTWKDMSSEMKISIKQARDLHDVQLDILTSQKNQFTTMEDIKDIQSEIIQTGESIFSLNTKESKELVIGLSEVGKAFGYGSEKAAELQKTFVMLGADESLALSLQQNLGLMTEMAGLSPQIISQDLVDGSEEVYTYFAGMPDQAAKAALQVRRMGMSIQQAGQIAKKMLNLEGFMTDMYELQAMTSGGIDFSNAFEKGLIGDIEGMTKDIMKDIGTTAEYNKMDFLTRKKIADTLGMSVEDLSKSVKLNEQIAQFQGPTKDALEENISRMGDISKLNKEQIVDRLKQLQSTDRLSVVWDKIKGVLLKAIIPLAESFADAIDAVSPIIDLIIGGLKGISLIFKIITPLVKGILAPFKYIGDLLSKITGYLDESANSTSVFGKVIKYVSDGLDNAGKYAYYLGAAIGTWTLLFKMPAVIGSIAGMFKSIISFIPGVSTIFGSLTSGIGGFFGILGNKSKDTMKETTDPVVNMTTKIHDSMVGMVGSIKSSMDEMVEHIKKSVGSIGTTVSKEFTKSPTQKLMEGVKKQGIDVSSTVSSAASKSASAMEDSISKGVDKSSKKIKELKDKSSNLIPTSPIKKSFGLITEMGTKSLALFASKSITSFLFAQREGEQKMSGMSSEIQGAIELAAMGGSSFLVDTLQEGIGKVFTKKLEKRFEKGMGGVTESITGKLSKVGEIGKGIFSSITGKFGKGIGEVESESKGVFSKIGSYGKSIFAKITSFGKTKLPEAGEAMTNSFDKIKEKLDPVSTITETIKRKVEKTTENVEIPKKTNTKITSPKVDIPKDTGKSASNIGSIFEKLSNVIKTAWKSIKAVLLDVVKFAGDVLKTITDAIGKSIENLLKGIGRGLSSFKTSAIKGAAALVLVSGALWITSKALENFSNVSWDSVGKGIATLGGLVVAALLLGKVSGQILIGAAAIAILGASLIPAAYALNMFAKIDWSSLAKAGVALLGLGVIGTLMSVVGPEMIIGAVALGIFSAALIVTGIALEKFNNVDWSSLAKAGVAMLGLGVIGTLMSTVAPAMIIGAVALGLLSAALIVTGIALEKFNNIGWDSLEKAGVALLGFGVAAAAFGLAAPIILVGAGVLAVASISLTLFAGAVMAINIGMKSLDVRPLKDLFMTLKDITSISAMSLFEVSSGIAAISASMAALSFVGVGTSIAKFFGGDTTKDLQRLADLADPLTMANEAISNLASSILDLSMVISGADFENIKKLNDLDIKPLDQEVNQKLNTIQGNYSTQQESTSVDYKITPQQPKAVEVLTPKKESVAQNVKVNHLPGTVQGSEEGETAYDGGVNSIQNSYYGKGSEEGIYNRPSLDTKKLEMLLMRLIQLNEMALQKDLVVNMDSQKVGTILKKNTNNG